MGYLLAQLFKATLPPPTYCSCSLSCLICVHCPSSFPRSGASWVSSLQQASSRLSRAVFAAGVSPRYGMAGKLRALAGLQDLPSSLVSNLIQDGKPVGWQRQLLGAMHGSRAPQMDGAVPSSLRHLSAGGSGLGFRAVVCPVPSPSCSMQLSHQKCHLSLFATSLALS